MLTSLFLLVSHELFDWSCRRSPVDLANNFGEIVKESFGVEPGYAGDREEEERSGRQRGAHRLKLSVF